MEEPEQAIAYARADFEGPHSRLIDLFRERFPAAPREARALDLGSGPGDVAYRFAVAFPGWLIDGVDGSNQCGRQVKFAEENIRTPARGFGCFTVSFLTGNRRALHTM